MNDGRVGGYAVSHSEAQMVVEEPEGLLFWAYKHCSTGCTSVPPLLQYVPKPDNTPTSHHMKINYERISCANRVTKLCKLTSRF